MARFFILVVSAVLLLLCLLWPHWHHYWLLPYDILYVVVFPQLFCVIHYKYANTYGAISALVVAIVLRLLFGGDDKIPMPAIVPLPFWDHIDGQLFPYRTLAMLISLLTLIFVSLFYHYLYIKGRVTSPNDIFVCFTNQRPTRKRPRVTLESVERTTVLWYTTFIYYISYEMYLLFAICCCNKISVASHTFSMWNSKFSKNRLWLPMCANYV